MPFNVDHHNYGFRISVGDGRPVQARDFGEIKRGLEHYFAKPAHIAELDDCPFCRAYRA